MEMVEVNGSIPAAPAINVVATGFELPGGLAIDRSGVILIADTGNNEVKEVVAVMVSYQQTQR